MAYAIARCYGNARPVAFTFDMKTFLTALAFSLAASPAVAENWYPAAFLSDGSTVAMDIDNIKRSPKAYERISFRLQVTGVGSVAQARMSGNCTTGTWRISSGRSNGGVAFTLDADKGDQVLRQACVMPPKIGR